MTVVRKMNVLLMANLLQLITPTVESHGHDQKIKYACEGSSLNIDCARSQRIEILFANFGRTSASICPKTNHSFDGVNCVSTKAKDAIYRTCHRKIFCTVMASSVSFGEDPCPGIYKYIDVIYKCARIVFDDTPKRKVTTTPSTTQTTSSTTTWKTKRDNGSISTPIITVEPSLFDELLILMKPNETNVKASKKERNDHGFFRSMLVILVVLKDKPKHSLLSMLTGVAAGTVLVFITVIVCVCIDKRRQRKDPPRFKDVKSNVETIELEESELLARESNENDCESRKSRDQVDSALGEEDMDGGLSTDYETASDLAYLNSYLDEYNKNLSLPLPPADQDDDKTNGQQFMSRRVHNDGSKGRSYEYNSNQAFSTFS